MDHRDEKLEATGGCRMCLAIPGKIIEITSDATHSGLVDGRMDLSKNVGASTFFSQTKHLAR